MEGINGVWKWIAAALLAFVSSVALIGVGFLINNLHVHRNEIGHPVTVERFRNLDRELADIRAVVATIPDMRSDIREIKHYLARLEQHNERTP